jgi:preprotein translocase subunit YajC
MTPLAAAAASPGGGSLSLLILALPVVVLLWLMFTQRRRAKAVTEAQAGLTVGDEVMAAAGIYGRVAQLDGEIVHLEVAPGVVVRVSRRAIVPPTEAGPTVRQDRTGTDDAGETA